MLYFNKGLLINISKTIFMATKTKRKPNAAFMKPLKVSEELAMDVGKGPLPRSEVVKKLWIYIKKHNLQDPKKRRNINADANLKAVFKGKGTVDMFEMTKLVSKHLS
jgi:chromatin remodeling complex protein RSC6